MPFVHISDTSLRVADVWHSDSWNLATLSTMLPLNVAHQITTVVVPRSPNGNDVVRWRATNYGSYSTTSSYAFLVDFNVADAGLWKHIW